MSARLRWTRSREYAGEIHDGRFHRYQWKDGWSLSVASTAERAAYRIWDLPSHGPFPSKAALDRAVVALKGGAKECGGCRYCSNRAAMKVKSKGAE